MQNIYVVALDTCDVALKFSPLRLVSSFWLSSGHLCLAMQFISEFIWVTLRWNGPNWQAKTTISYFARDVLRTSWVYDTAYSAWTNQRLKIVDLRPISGLRSADLRYGLKKENTTEPILRLGPRLRAGLSKNTIEVRQNCLSAATNRAFDRPAN